MKTPLRHLRFRTKLLVAMMSVVVAVTGAAVLLTQQRMVAGRQQLLRSEFQRQLDYHLALQAERRVSLTELGAELAAWAEEESRTNAAFLPSLRPSLPVATGTAGPRERLWQTSSLLSTNSAFRELLRRAGMESRGGPQRGREGGTGFMLPRLRRGEFLAVVDDQGESIVTLPPERERVFGLPNETPRHQRLGFVRSVMHSTGEQQVGCVALASPADAQLRDSLNLLRPMSQPGGSSNEVLFEVAFHRVSGPGTHRLLGAFVTGVPVPDLLQRPGLRSARAEPATNAVPAPPFLPAMWVDGEFYADPDDIPAALAMALRQELAQRMGRKAVTEADFRLTHAGHHYWVFTRLQNPQSAFPPAWQVCLYNLDAPVTEARQLRWQILAAGGVVLLLALAVSGVITHNFSRPIRDLVAGTGQIRLGNFEARVAVRSGDELGQLAGSFNEMAAGLAQKERYRTVLNMVADAKIAQRLIEGAITLGGEEREVTVLFCDIRGFTAHTEHMPPGEVIELLNEHMSALTRVVKEHDGVLDKFVGDLLMAIFGAPLRHEHDALNAARCALGLIAERERLNQTSRHALRIGVGLATGRVVAGCMGSAERLNYTVLGERVNLGSRLCDEAAPGEVLMDDATRERLGDAAEARPRGALPLSGFSEPMTVWHLVAVK